MPFKSQHPVSELQSDDLKLISMAIDTAISVNLDD